MSVLAGIDTDVGGYGRGGYDVRGRDVGGHDAGGYDVGGRDSGGRLNAGQRTVAASGSAPGSISSSPSQPGSFRSSWQAQLASLDSGLASDPQTALDTDGIATAENAVASGATTPEPASTQALSSATATTLLSRLASHQRLQNASSTTPSNQAPAPAQATARDAIEGVPQTGSERPATAANTPGGAVTTEAPANHGTMRRHGSKDSGTPQSPDPSAAVLPAALPSPVAVPAAQSIDTRANAEQPASIESIPTGPTPAATPATVGAAGLTPEQAGAQSAATSITPPYGPASTSDQEAPTSGQAAPGSFERTAIGDVRSQPASPQLAPEESLLPGRHAAGNADAGTETPAASVPVSQDVSLAALPQSDNQNPGAATATPASQSAASPVQPSDAADPQSLLSSTRALPAAQPAAASASQPATPSAVTSLASGSPQVLNHQESVLASDAQSSSAGERPTGQPSAQLIEPQVPLQPAAASMQSALPSSSQLPAAQDQAAPPAGSIALNATTDDAASPVAPPPTASRPAASIRSSDYAAARSPRKVEAGGLPQQVGHQLPAPDLLAVRDASNLARAENVAEAAFRTAGSSVSNPTTSATGSPQGTAFAALDSAAPSESARWTHAGPQRAEAGYQDPALGWIGVRAESARGQVHATLLPGSSDAAEVLGGHMAGLHAYLAGAHTSVQTVSLAAPEGRETTFGNAPDHGTNQNMQQSMSQNSGQNSAFQQPSNPLPNLSDSTVPARSGAFASPAVSTQPATPTEGSGAYVSVMA